MGLFVVNVQQSTILFETNYKYFHTEPINPLDFGHPIPELQNKQKKLSPQDTSLYLNKVSPLVKKKKKLISIHPNPQKLIE